MKGQRREKILIRSSTNYPTTELFTVKKTIWNKLIDIDLIFYSKLNTITYEDKHN